MLKFEIPLDKTPLPSPCRSAIAHAPQEQDPKEHGDQGQKGRGGHDLGRQLPVASQLVAHGHGGHRRGRRRRGHKAHQGRVPKAHKHRRRDHQKGGQQKLHRRHPQDQSPVPGHGLEGQRRPHQHHGKGGGGAAQGSHGLVQILGEGDLAKGAEGAQGGGDDQGVFDDLQQDLPHMQPAAPQQLEGAHGHQIEQGHDDGHQQAHRADVLRPAELLGVGQAQKDEVAPIHGLDGHGGPLGIPDDPGHRQHVESEEQDDGTHAKEQEPAVLGPGEVGAAHVVEQAEKQEGPEQEGVHLGQILCLQDLHPPQQGPGGHIEIQGEEGEKGVDQQAHRLTPLPAACAAT